MQSPVLQGVVEEIVINFIPLERDYSMSGTSSSYIIIGFITIVVFLLLSLEGEAIWFGGIVVGAWMVMRGAHLVSLEKSTSQHQQTQTVVTPPVSFISQQDSGFKYLLDSLHEDINSLEKRKVKARRTATGAALLLAFPFVAHTLLLYNYLDGDVCLLELAGFSCGLILIRKWKKKRIREYETELETMKARQLELENKFISKLQTREIDGGFNINP